MKKEFITMYQRPPLSFPEPGTKEYRFFLNAGSISSIFILPEYFGFEKLDGNFREFLVQSEKILKMLIELSLTREFENTLIIGGSLIYGENQFFYNASPVIFNGKVLSYYFKKTLFEKERSFLTGGHDNLVIIHPYTGKKIGFLICADVLDQDNFKQYKNIDYIAIPVASPFRPDDTPEVQIQRDRSIFLNGAKLTNSIIFKCCLAAPVETSVDFNHNRIQGRSLITDPENIKIRVPHIRWRGLILYSEINQSVKLQEFS